MLLFVNVSIGGTLTHFAAPPVSWSPVRGSWTTSYCSPTLAGVRSSPSSYRRAAHCRVQEKSCALASSRAAVPTSSNRSGDCSGREPASVPVWIVVARGLHGVDCRERALPGAVHRRVPVLSGVRAGDERPFQSRGIEIRSPPVFRGLLFWAAVSRSRQAAAWPGGSSRQPGRRRPRRRRLGPPHSRRLANDERPVALPRGRSSADPGRSNAGRPRLSERRAAAGDLTVTRECAESRRSGAARTKVLLDHSICLPIRLLLGALCADFSSRRWQLRLCGICYVVGGAIFRSPTSSPAGESSTFSPRNCLMN